MHEIFPGDRNHPSAPYGLGMRVPMIVVSPWSRGGFTIRRWGLEDSAGWYDLRVTVVGDAGFAQQFAGHVETGRDSMSDPALGGLVEHR